MHIQFICHLHRHSKSNYTVNSLLTYEISMKLNSLVDIINCRIVYCLTGVNEHTYVVLDVCNSFSTASIHHCVFLNVFKSHSAWRLLLMLFNSIWLRFDKDTSNLLPFFQRLLKNLATNICRVNYIQRKKSQFVRKCYISVSNWTNINFNDLITQNCIVFILSVVQRTVCILYVTNFSCIFAKKTFSLSPFLSIYLCIIKFVFM